MISVPSKSVIFEKMHFLHASRSLPSSIQPPSPPPPTEGEIILHYTRLKGLHTTHSLSTWGRRWTSQRMLRARLSPCTWLRACCHLSGQNRRIKFEPQEVSMWFIPQAYFENCHHRVPGIVQGAADKKIRPNHPCPSQMAQSECHIIFQNVLFVGSL